MPDIVFDPPDETPVMQGGALEGAKRAEYMELCKQMTSRNPSLNYPQIRDAILTIIEEDVRGYIQSLPEPDRDSLIRDVDTIFSSIDSTDPNYIVTINIVSFQICILFTKYTDKIDSIEYSEIYTAVVSNDEWKLYTNMKHFLHQDFVLNDPSYVKYLLNLESPKYIYMTFIGFLRLGEIVESYLNNIFYIGLSYALKWVDGVIVSPSVYLEHDIDHAASYIRECTSKFPKILNSFKQFRKYVVSTKDAVVRYSIDFALFFFLHEAPWCSIFEKSGDTLENNLQNNSTVETVYARLSIRNIVHGYYDLRIGGRAIPVAYREMINENELNKEKVHEYIRLVADRYVACWNEFREAVLKPSKGGRRQQKTHRRYRKKRGIRKTRIRRS
jgi:hypothetical protein